VVSDGGRRRRLWVAGATAFVAAVFAVVAGFAPALVPTKWVAAHQALLWSVILVMAVLATVLSVWGQRTDRTDAARADSAGNRPGNGTAMFTASKHSARASAEGLVYRESTMQTAVDGSTTTKVIEIFDAQVVRLRLGPPSESDGET